MNVHDPSVIELEAAIDGAPHDKRVESLRRVTDLFVAGAESFNEEHLAIFERVLERLIEEIETAVLAEIGQRLAPISNAPVGIVRNLAHHDEIAVAGPVLARSQRLALAELLHIAETKSQAHLKAISSRARVEEAVTDVLVRRGDDDVVRTLAANGGASFSEIGMGTLADRAAGDEMLAEQVVQRPDVPPHVFCKLLVAATGVVRERLLAVLTPEARAEADRVLEKVSGEIADRTPTRRTYGSAIRRVLVESSQAKLGEDNLLTYASNGEADETIATLSLLSSVPTEKIDQLMETEQHETLLIICRAAGLSWRGARAMILLSRHAGALSPDHVLELHQTFEGLKESDAQHMLRLWRLDS
jgi:uncharacterized protein (DUF2336 family)